MPLIGYARVSTEDQTPLPQSQALKSAGCVEIHEEQASGGNRARPVLARVLERIGVADCFSGLFAIEDGDLTPKPAPATFRRMLERFNIDPRQAAFFEDTPRNLEPAKAMGMTTVLIGDGHGKPLGPHIDHVAPDLLDFLSDLNLKDAA